MLHLLPFKVLLSFMPRSYGSAISRVWHCVPPYMEQLKDWLEWTYGHWTRNFAISLYLAQCSLSSYHWSILTKNNRRYLKELSCSHVQATKCHLFQNKHNRSKRTSMNKRTQRSLALHIFWQVRQDRPVIKTYLLHLALWLVQKTCAIFSTNETPDEHHLWPNHPCFPPLLVVCPTVLALSS